LTIGELASIALDLGLPPQRRFFSAFMLAVWRAHDPITMMAFAALLVTVPLAANYIPAYRPTKIDAMVALKYE